tara:strand:- start:192 stop:527 length:336 start_codon:yes stop_codon:yes gene_type:complete
VDPSDEGVAQANHRYPELNLKKASAYDNLQAAYDEFPVVISLEVVEHLYAPRNFAKTLFNLVAANGHAIISTPYRGYLKNLAIAVVGGGRSSLYGALGSRSFKILVNGYSD